MSAFVINDDMFGRYCKIPTGYSREMHTYKIVCRIESNAYCDMPLYSRSEKKWHKEIVPVLLVIHCGVCEEEVQRVAESDCEILPIPELLYTEEDVRSAYNDGYACGMEQGIEAERSKQE